MRVLRRPALTVVAAAVAFLGGWACARTEGPEPARADAASGGARPTHAEEPEACTDRLAMEANANLVEQIRAYRTRLDLAEARSQEAERKLASVADAPPARVVTTREEWARMAAQRTIRLRVPCARWNTGQSYTVRRVGRHGLGIRRASRSFETGSRADAAGLSPEELETLEGVYDRTHKRTWAAMRSACEASAAYREAVASREPGGVDLTDRERVEHCRSLVDPDDPSTRAALVRVAELHAASAGIDRASTDEQRIVFALTRGPADLFEEMSRTFGREKATRAVDNGVVCVDETLFDLRRADEG